MNVGGIHTAAHTDATITVSDTGRGIPDEHLEHIFEVFVALAHSESRQVRGDGLGLSISQKVARLMGGDLTVQSTVGDGSTFTLLPLRRAEMAAQGSSAPTDDATIETAKSILIVDDNMINCSVSRDMLERLGHDVSGAFDGLQGPKTAKERAFDQIIMDGVEALRRIRSEADPNKRTRTLGLTAHGRVMANTS